MHGMPLVRRVVKEHRRAVLALIIALALTGALSAKVGSANILRAIVRVVVGGALAMIVTYSVGKLSGVSGV
jgi:VIT1/CCC1 family predicted Fe2+/Mn2+ transporter